MKTPLKFNQHVCCEMMLGVPIEKRTGRVVQIRKGVGAFGSDIYLLRLRDGSLMAFENVMVRAVGDEQFENSFYRSNGQEPPAIPEQPPYEWDGKDGDAEDVEYTLKAGFPETGFIIENPKQPASEIQSFAMAIISPE